MWSDYHLILMEYLENFKTVHHHYLENHYSLNLNREMINTNIKNLLDDIHKEQIVHGDFRAINIMAKLDEINGQSLTDFKLIDFEISGPAAISSIDNDLDHSNLNKSKSKCYRCLIFKNRGVHWPEGFNSFKPRKFEHDIYMWKQI